MGSLNAFIDKWRDVPFSWDDNHCLMFLFRGVYAQTGRWLHDIDDLRCKDDRDAARRLTGFMREQGCVEMTDVIDLHMNRSASIPPEGHVVARPGRSRFGVGLACGFVSGCRGVFVDRDGLQFIKLDPRCDVYWNLPNVDI